LPAPAQQERVRAVGGQMNEVKLVIPESLYKDIERLCQIRGSSLIEAISFAVTQTLKQKDPVQKALRNQNKPHEPSLRKAPRRIPMKAVHEVYRRDQGRCAFRYPDGKRCENRRWLHLHHQVPVSKGGPDTAANLTTLCSAHHRIHHAGDARAQGLASSALNSRAPLHSGNRP